MLRRTMLVALLVGLVGFVFTSVAAADETSPVRVAGKLTKIDGKALSIAADDGSDVTITVNDATKFRRDGDKDAAVTLADLQVGQSVRAYYNKADNVATAVIIAKTP